MSKEETKTETVEVNVEALQESVATTKTALGEAKSELKKFRNKNKIRNRTNVKDAEVAKAYDALQAVVDAATQAHEDAKAALAAVKPAKKTGGGGGGESYGYIQIPGEDGTMRDLTKSEKKRWRAHARKQAAKDGIAAKDVPMDPDWFKPKVKKEEKPKAEAKAADAPEPGAKATKAPAETPAETPAKSKGKTKRRSK